MKTEHLKQIHSHIVFPMQTSDSDTHIAAEKLKMSYETFNFNSDVTKKQHVSR